MNELEQRRYARQIRLPQVGEVGQQRLLDAGVLIVGMGGLGSPVAMYLAAAGVGRLLLSDYDRVDESNLQRQIVHRCGDIGELKAESARRTLLAINPGIKVEAIDYELDEEEMEERARKVDLLVDCTDNFPSRFALNRVSLATATPLVSGAAIRWEGQVTAFDPRRGDSPCYRCLYRDEGAESATCAMEGVISPLVGVIGAMQALESVNLLLGNGALVGRLLLFDGRLMEWQKIRLPKDPKCPACGGAAVTGSRWSASRGR